jgi:hypothetical protein
MAMGRFSSSLWQKNENQNISDLNRETMPKFGKNNTAFLVLRPQNGVDNNPSFY